MTWLRYLLQQLFGALSGLFSRLRLAFGATSEAAKENSEILTKPNPDPTLTMPPTVEIEPKKLTSPSQLSARLGRSGMEFLSGLPTVPFGAIEKISEEFSLDPFLVAAIIRVESNGERFAMRYEPHYSYLFHVEQMAKKVGSSEATENTMQKTSWGLMQIMGAVARERGYRGWLSELTDMLVNLKYGCVHLQSYFERHGKLEHAIASYNAGSPRFLSDGQFVNQPYVDKVLRFYKKFQNERAS